MRQSMCENCVADRSYCSRLLFEPSGFIGGGQHRGFRDEAIGKDRPAEKMGALISFIPGFVA